MRRMFEDTMNHSEYCQEPYDGLDARILFLMRCQDYKIQPSHTWIGYFILKRLPNYGRNPLTKAEGLVLFLVKQFDYQRDLTDIADKYTNNVCRNITRFVESNRWNFKTVEEPLSLTAQDTFILQHDNKWLTDEYFTKTNSLLKKLDEKGLQLSNPSMKAAACYIISCTMKDKYGTYLRQSRLGKTFNTTEVSIRNATRKAEEIL